MARRSDTVSLLVALEHGNARYKDPSVPWRIHKGQPQVGVPATNVDGEPTKKLTWIDVETWVAEQRWYQSGWVLR